MPEAPAHSEMAKHAASAANSAASAHQRALCRFIVCRAGVEIRIEDGQQVFVGFGPAGVGLVVEQFAREHVNSAFLYGGERAPRGVGSEQGIEGGERFFFIGTHGNHKEELR